MRSLVRCRTDTPLFRFQDASRAIVLDCEREFVIRKSARSVLRVGFFDNKGLGVHMNIIAGHLRCRTWSLTVMLIALAAGCSGDRTPILGSGGAALAPKVIAVTPMAGAIGVPTNKTVINATFNEAVATFSGGASFTVTCAAPCVDAAGTVSLDATGTIATFTLTPGTALAPLTLYTATVTGATNPASGLALASPFVWQFTTGVTPPPPTVIAVVPLDNAIGVPLNDSVTAE